jgi:acyl-CoA synthetase (AMP-forming)/AMP-acid ligase II
VTDLIRRLDDETPASSPIALCLDNGLSFVTCMLGALWAGHSFMPVAIDPQVIQMQMLGMLAQMHVKILFCAPELAPAVQAVVARCAHPVHVCVLDDDEVLFPAKARHCMALARSLYGAYSDAPVLPALPRARCHERVCTFHTSGTTGTPKPIHNSHAEWAAFVRAAAAAYHMTADSRVFVATSHIFDPSAGLTFAALALGASACLAPWAHTLTELRENNIIIDDNTMKRIILANLTGKDGAMPEALVEAGGDAAGKVRIQGIAVQPISDCRIRLGFQILPAEEGGKLADVGAVELRAALQRDGDFLTETWIYRINP